MKEIKRIEKFQTTDGKEFDDQEAALKHQRELQKTENCQEQQISELLQKIEEICPCPKMRQRLIRRDMVDYKNPSNETLIKEYGWIIDYLNDGVDAPKRYYPAHWGDYDTSLDTIEEIIENAKENADANDPITIHDALDGAGWLDLDSDDWQKPLKFEVEIDVSFEIKLKED